MYKRGMVFGVFDGLHEGHAFFLKAAKEKCETLIVVVARDEEVQRLKGRMPREGIGKRMDAISAFMPEALVVAGDPDPNSWRVLSIHAPDAVFLGYDQQAIGEALDARGTPHLFLPAYEPGTYKSSLMRNPEEGGEVSGV